MKKIMELKHDQAIKLDNISKRIEILKTLNKVEADSANRSKQLEEMEAKDVSVNESVNEYDSSKDDELAVAQFGPGRE